MVQQGKILTTRSYLSIRFPLHYTSMTEKEVDLSRYQKTQKKKHANIRNNILRRGEMPYSLTSVNSCKCNQLSFNFPFLSFYQKYEVRQCHSFFLRRAGQ